MTKNVKFEIFDILLEGEVLSPMTTKITRAYAEKWNMSGYHAILATHVLSEAFLADALGKLLKIDRIWQVKSFEPDDKSLVILPFRRCREWEVMPIGASSTHPDKIEIVMADPTRTDYIQELEKVAGEQLTLAVSERSDIVSAIDLVYPLSDQLPGLYGPMES
jgi:hypothetical protein